MDKKTDLGIIDGGLTKEQSRAQEAEDGSRFIRVARALTAYALAERIEYDWFNDCYRGPSGRYDYRQLGSKAWAHNAKGSERPYIIVAQEMYERQRLDCIARAKGRILEVEHDRAGARAELDKVLSLMLPQGSSTAERTLASTALRQIIWQVKRRMRGLTTAWDIMLVFYSKQGTGKSTLMSKLGAPLSALYRGNADFGIFEDKFSSAEFTQRYLINFDEMGRANRADISKIKQVITAENIQTRRMYSDCQVTQRRNCSFIATTNLPLAQTLSDPSGMRRFTQVKCSDEPVTDSWVKGMEAIDFEKLWQCESGEAGSAPPFAGQAELFRDHQESLRTPGDFEYWASQALEHTKDPADKVLNKAAHVAYATHCRFQGRPFSPIQKFPALMRERYNLKETKTNGSVYYSGFTLKDELND